MKHKIRRSTSVAIITICLVFITQFVYANTKEPGSSEDPIVTLSFVEQRIEQLKFYVDQKVDSIGKSSDTASDTESSTNTFEVVELKAGQSLIASASTEIILRGGTALGIDSQLGGISDITGARDIRRDEIIPANHMLIVPRNDGRGVRATTNAILMVRGGYQIVN